MNPLPISIHKITVLGLTLLALTLPACTGSWLADPLSRYVQRKTGLAIQIKEVDWDLRSLTVTLKKITLNVEQPASKGRVVLPGLRLRFNWKLSEDLPFAPRFWIEQLVIDSPQVSLRWGKTDETSDWHGWLKQIPAIRQWEIRNLSGRLEREGLVLQTRLGATLSGAFQPDQPARFTFRCPKIEADFTDPLRSFKGEVQGSLEISPPSKPMTYGGNLAFSGAYRQPHRVRLEGLSGTLRVEGTPAALEVKVGMVRFSQVEAASGGYVFSGEGPATVRGSLRLIHAESQTRVYPKLTVQGDEIRYRLQKEARQITGQARGLVQVEGSWEQPALQGVLETSQTGLELPPVRITGLEGRLEFKGGLARVAFPRVSARAETFLWEKGGRPLRLDHPETKFRALFIPGKHRWAFEEVFLQDDAWGALQGDLVFDPALGGTPDGSVRLLRFPLLRMINLLASGPVQKEMESWPVTGTLAWSREKKDAPLDFRVALSASGLEGADAGGRSWTVKSLDTRVTARLAWDPAGREISGLWKQEFLKGSLAYEDWVFSFNAAPLPMEFKGKISVPPDGFRVRGSLNLRHPSLGIWSGSGDLDWGSPGILYQGRISGTEIPLQESASLLAEQAEGNRFPWLRRMEPRGEVSAELSLEGFNRDYRIQGRVQGSELDFNFRDPGIRFQVSELDLPVRWGSTPFREPGDPAPQTGRIQLRDLRTPWSSVSFMEIPVSAGFKVYRIPAPLAFPLWGGELTARGITFDGSGDRPALRAEANLSRANLSAVLPGRAIEGNLEGDLGTITLMADQVSASGELTARVFEGTFQARELNLVQPFSAERRFRGRILFDHISLEPLTRLFSFGKISGFVQGSVEHLSLGQDFPERFHLTLKTQEVAGVAKRINVQAIENVSLLGTGWGELGGLRSGINRWFQEYPYREIGLTCTLLEGRVTLRGTIFEEDLEFLVRKPGLIGIDVINRNPENEIDFSDMLERFRRINTKGGENDAQ